MANDIINMIRESSLYRADTKPIIVIARGTPNPDFIFFGEAPSKDDTIPFAGKGGKLVESWLRECGIESYLFTNVFPLAIIGNDGHERKPMMEEIDEYEFFSKAIIEKNKPKYIVCFGDTASQAIIKLPISETFGKAFDLHGAVVTTMYAPSYYLQNGGVSADQFRLALKVLGYELKQQGKYKKEAEYQCKQAEAMALFAATIGTKMSGEKEFVYEGERWLADYHPFDHSDDLIVHESEADKYDKFLLVKVGSDRTRIAGWTDKKQLLSTPKRDIYRNGKYYYMVVDTNMNDLSSFKITDKKLVLKNDFTINQQKAENLGGTEMINPLLAGMHFFAKQAKLYFKDINQRDECIIGEKKCKIYTRDAMSDEDMLIHEEYFAKHPEIDTYICCKIKGGAFKYLGYVTRELVAQTRIVQMIGQDSTTASKDIRRIFAEQYKPMSDLISIWEEETEQEEEIVPQHYVPLHAHTEYSVGDAFGRIAYVCDALKKRGFSAAAITDHGSLAGAYEFQKAMLERNLKPIIGYEGYFSFDGHEGRYHMLLFAKNEAGWKTLMRLHAAANRDHFYYRPIIPFNMLLSDHEGLIVTSGCSSSLTNKLLSKGETEQAEQHFKLLKEVFGDDFYAEMQPHGITDNQVCLQKIHEFAGKYDVKSIITTDSHYPYPQDKKYHEAVKAIDMKKPYGTAGYGDDCFFLMKDDELKAKLAKDGAWQLPFIDEFMKNTFEISDKCDCKIAKTESDTLPDYQPIHAKTVEIGLYEEFCKWKKEVEIDEKLMMLSTHARVDDE